MISHACRICTEIGYMYITFEEVITELQYMYYYSETVPNSHTRECDNDDVSTGGRS